MSPAHWTVAAVESAGGREEQQDRVAAFVHGSAVLAVVADGLGGHRGGGAAAQAVVDCARARWEAAAHPIADVAAFLEIIRSEAHASIAALAAEFGEPPYSTCVLFHSNGGRVDWLHVGDSRLYRLRDGRMAQMTRDHSYAQVLVEQGKLRPDEVASHPSQGQLLIALGGEADQGGDLGGDELNSADAFCLCTDGAWESLVPEDMVKALQASDLDQAAADLVQRARDMGGPGGDNIALALVRTENAPVRRRSFWDRLLGRGKTP